MKLCLHVDDFFIFADMLPSSDFKWVLRSLHPASRREGGVSDALCVLHGHIFVGSLYHIIIFFNSFMFEENSSKVSLDKGITVKGLEVSGIYSLMSQFPFNFTKCFFK